MEAERRQSRDSRAVRVVAYLAMIAAGAVLPTVVMSTPGLSKPLWLTMCSWLVLGGLFAGVGQVIRRWVGEYVGLPLLFSALLGFGLLQGDLARWALPSIPSVALLWSFGLLVFARWRDVTALYRAAPRRLS